MLYEITVFKEMGNKRQRIYTKKVRAINSVIAFERACIRLGPKEDKNMRSLKRIFRKILEILRIKESERKVVLRRLKEII